MLKQIKNNKTGFLVLGMAAFAIVPYLYTSIKEKLNKQIAIQKEKP